MSTENDICSNPEFDNFTSCLCSVEILNNSTDDLNNDDYNNEMNSLGTENNNNLDINEQYELWIDYGADMLVDSLENNYFNNEAVVALGSNLYDLDFENIPNIGDEINFDPPLINDLYEVALWISNITKIDDNKFEIYKKKNYHYLKLLQKN